MNAERFARNCAQGTVAATMLFSALAMGRAAAADESIAERRERVEQMEPQEREQISQNYERFRHMDQAERNRLRQLHDDLEAAPDREELRVVMQQYHEWLSELPAGQRMMLAALPPEERLNRIDEIRAAQRQVFKLSPEDRQAIREWAKKHNVMSKWAEARRSNSEPTLTPEELIDLRAGLTEPAQHAFDQAQNTEQRRKLLKSWAAQGLYQGGPGGRPGSRRPSAEELQAFQREHLSEEERSRLLSLPPEQMHREVWRLWREHHAKDAKDGDDRRGPPGDRSPDGPPRRGRSGQGKGPPPSST